MIKIIPIVLFLISFSVVIFSVSAHGREPETDDEYSFFIGSDVMEMETKMTFSTESDTFTSEGTRYRMGFESGGVFSFGLEYTQNLEEEAHWDIGATVRLKTENAFGAFITVGEPVYLRIGWSTWEATYSIVDWDLSDKQRMTSLDYGLGFKVKVAPKFSVYGEYIKRNATARFSGIFNKPAGAAHVELPYSVEMYVAGVIFSF